MLTLAATDCSLVVEAEQKQCSTNADCVGLGAGFEGTFCNEQSVCQNNLEYCSTNQQCLERTQIETSVCRQSDHRCINLVTSQCPRLLSDRDDLLKDPLIVAHLGFATAAPGAVAYDQGLEIARREFRDQTGGCPARRRGAPSSSSPATFR